MKTPTEQYDQLVKDEEAVKYQYPEPKMVKFDLIALWEVIKTLKHRFKEKKV